MKGIPLVSLTEQLHEVELGEHNVNPALAVSFAPALRPRFWQEVRERYGQYDPVGKYHELPLAAFADFSFDELCKLYYATFISVDRTVEALFCESPCHEVVRKLSSSLWRWGYSRGTWNEIVHAYRAFTQFSFGDNPDFAVRLDYTTSVNECGYSKYHRVYLDGVFGIMVYHKGVHVMTIGFSIAAERKVLIQQVQMVQKKGNRFLFQMASNRMEYVLQLFARSFPGYQLYVIDGASLSRKTAAQYQEALERARSNCERLKERLARATSEEDAQRYTADLSEEEQTIAMCTERITRLQTTEGRRLASLYRDVGKFSLGPRLTLNRLHHHQVLA